RRLRCDRACYAILRRSCPLTMRNPAANHPTRKGKEFAFSTGGVRLAFFQLGVEPGPGIRPPAVGRVRRDAERLRGLWDSQAGEVAQLDQASFRLIDLLKVLQGFFEGQDIERGLGSGDFDVCGVLALAAAAVTLRLLAACLVDENTAHGLGGGGE